MRRKTQGHYEVSSTVGERVRAFVPSPLPPAPDIQWNPPLRLLFDEALLALGRLDSVSSLLPDTALFQYMYVRKEAVLSSKIEGTQSTLTDLLLYEMEQSPGVPVEDAREVSNYASALNHGVYRIRSGFPLSLRLMNEIHGILLSKGRGSFKTPGVFRSSQNWIGGTRPGNASFVPPPPDKVMECMGKLELFLHDKPVVTPPLLKAALAHVQFETIHPYLDGNGRLGRMLVTLVLCERRVLKEPMLYLSLHLKKHRQIYYDLLGEVRSKGDWEAWLEFFAEGVIASAASAVDMSTKALAVFKRDAVSIGGVGRAADSTAAVHRAMMERPLATSGWLVERTKLTPATVNKSLSHLVRLKIVRELSGKMRNRIFSYGRFVDVLNSDEAI